MKKELERINEKYKRHLIGGVRKIRYRQYADDKHSKYLFTYVANLGIVDNFGNRYSFFIDKNSLEEFEKEIEYLLNKYKGK